MVATRLNRWLAEFRDPKREVEFLDREAETHLPGLQIGLLAIVSLSVLSAWIDLRLFRRVAPWDAELMLVAWGLRWLGLLVAGAGMWRRRWHSATGWAYVLGAALLSVGHNLGSYLIHIDAAIPPSPLWSSFFVLLALVVFIQPLRFAVPAAGCFVLGFWVVYFTSVPWTERGAVMSSVALLMALALGTAVSYRLNRARRLEFAALELERLTSLSLSDEVQELARARGDLEARATDLETRLIAAQRLEAIGRLAGGVAHDLNNLLTPILGYTDLALAEVSRASDVEKMLQMVMRSATNAQELVRQLLAFGRRQRLRPVRFDLSRMVADEEAALHALMSPDVRLSLVPGGADTEVCADRSQLVQVLVNLVVNARDATANAGQIEVSVRSAEVDAALAEQLALTAPGCYVKLAVRDDGSGMDAATRSRIFEPFFTTKGEHKGTGLGLATVYGIIKQHRGAVFVDSELGKGSTFSVWLPAAVPGEGDEEDSRVSLPMSLRGGDETILVVDDDVVIAGLISRILVRQGYRVTLAESVEEALRFGRESPAALDLVICDLDVADRDALWAELHQRHPGAVELLVSGDPSTLARSSDPPDPLTLPFTRAELVTRVRRVLDRRTPAKPE